MKKALLSEIQDETLRDHEFMAFKDISIKDEIKKLPLMKRILTSIILPILESILIDILKFYGEKLTDKLQNRGILK